MSIELTRSAEALAADPAFSSTYAPLAGLYLPGVAGNYVNTPDDPSLDITGDIDLRCHVAMDDWTPAVVQSFICRFVFTAGRRAFAFQLETSGVFRYVASTDGSGSTTYNSTIAPVVADGEALWIRVTHRKSDGRIQFLTAASQVESPSSWTQVGADVAGFTANTFGGTATLEVGTISDGSGNPTAGTVYRAQVYNGIGGTLVADYRADIPAARYVDSTGKVWTVNGTANGWVIR